jgi:hypothetical protein
MCKLGCILRRGAEGLGHTSHANLGRQGRSIGRGSDGLLVPALLHEKAKQAHGDGWPPSTGGSGSVRMVLLRLCRLVVVLVRVVDFGFLAMCVSQGPLRLHRHSMHPRRGETQSEEHDDGHAKGKRTAREGRKAREDQ